MKHCNNILFVQAAKCNFTDTDRQIKKQIKLMTPNNKFRQYLF